MSNDPDLNKLILANLDDLDAAAKQVGVIEGIIWEAIGERMRTWASTNGWQGEFDVEADLKIYPAEWIDGDVAWAWFGIGFGPTDSGEGAEGEPFFHLSRLTGAAGGRLCIWLSHGIRRSAWRDAFRLAAERGENGDFVLDDKHGLYIDCTPPSGAMTEAVYENDFGAALARLNSAMDSARNSLPTIDKILRAARG